MAEIKRPTVMGYPPPPPNSADPLPCPRCNSTVTKFCYYNNYNLAQPRHFCRSCRRYWTHGGALRDVPVGGGTRKNKAKRSRNQAAAGSSSSTSPSSSSLTHETKPIVDKSSDEHLLNLNDDIAAATSTSGGLFSSLMMMNSQEQTGFLSLGGYGYGYGYGFQQGFGYGARAAGVWEFPPEGASVNAVPAYSSGFNTWQMPGADHEAGQGGLVEDNGSHCFDWPELDISNSISMPAVKGKQPNSSSTSSNPRLNSPAF